MGISFVMRPLRRFRGIGLRAALSSWRESQQVCRQLSPED
jgi:hypothetical protein